MIIYNKHANTIHSGPITSPYLRDPERAGTSNPRGCVAIIILIDDGTEEVGGGAEPHAHKTLLQEPGYPIIVDFRSSDHPIRVIPT